MNKLIQSTVPVLASLNLNESISFYTKQLGFIQELVTDNYAIVSRNQTELHFWLCSERHIAENTSCYIRTSNIDDLHKELVDKGLNLKPPIVQPWGMKELYVIDPHGNLLKFGQTV